MNEKHRRLYEQLGYKGPDATAGPGSADAADAAARTAAMSHEALPSEIVQEAGAGKPVVDPAEMPPLGPEGIAELERALNLRPKQTLKRAREVIDEDISEAELRATIARARMALDSPETAVASLATESDHMDSANQLPPGFNFDGMNLDEIDIRPGDTKFETVADALGWAFLAGPFLLTQGFKATFRTHANAASGFVYALDEPAANAPLDVALFSDFGTGRYYSRYIAKHLRTRKFPYAVHLGDVYYAGRRSEFEDYFAAPLDPILADTKLFALNSNHEMYSGGKPYFEFMDKRRAAHPSKQQQEGSYFCLRSSRFQIIGIDTAYFNHGRHKDKKLSEWLAARLREGRQAGRVNILLSADHPYGYGHEGRSDLLKKDLAPLVLNEKLIDLWFWGNTHYCALFDRTNDLPFVSSCIGHAGYPYDRQSPGRHEPAPLLFLETEARFPEWTGLRQDRGNNGYCVMSLRAHGSVGLKYLDWMARTRCEAELSRTQDDHLSVASVVVPQA